MATARKPFTPPHCPRSDCDSHADSGHWRFKKKGFFVRSGDRRTIQRYLCQHCQRSFSSQTFSTTYWLKRPDLQRPLFWRLLACSALRQIAHELGTTHTTLQRHAERLGRHCLLFHERLRPPPHEPLVLDGLRTFEAGQYWPFDLNVLVGRSHFVYGFNEAELRRSGTMTPAQKRRRAQLEARYGRPVPQATRQAVLELVGRVVPERASVSIDSDEHQAYPQAFLRLRDRSIEHHTTSSRAPRTARNPLFAANLADLLLRHTGANHKRETIAFSKRRQGAMYRAAIFAVWRNYVKWSSERRKTPPPAVALGVIGKRLTVEQILGRRLFPWREKLEGWPRRCYYGRIRTRSIARCQTHRLAYAE